MTALTATETMTAVIAIANAISTDDIDEGARIVSSAAANRTVASAAAIVARDYPTLDAKFATKLANTAAWVATKVWHEDWTGETKPSTFCLTRDDRDMAVYKIQLAETRAAAEREMTAFKAANVTLVERNGRMELSTRVPAAVWADIKHLMERHGMSAALRAEMVEDGALWAADETPGWHVAKGCESAVRRILAEAAAK